MIEEKPLYVFVAEIVFEGDEKATKVDVESKHDIETSLRMLKEDGQNVLSIKPKMELI